MTKVPGELHFTLDVRAYSSAHLQELDAKTLTIIRSIEERHGVRFELGHIARHGRRDGIGDLRRFWLAIPTRRLVSPASHDSAAFSAAGVPMAMIFVRNTTGSHNPSETITIDDFLQGTAIITTWVANVLQ